MEEADRHGKRSEQRFLNKKKILNWKKVKMRERFEEINLKCQNQTKCQTSFLIDANYGMFGE